MSAESTNAPSVVVISQLPPPVHGSTVVTKTLIETLNSLNVQTQLVDRRFSRSVSAVGKFSLKKLASALWMPFRLMNALVRVRPDYVVLFTTNRTFSFLVDCVLSAILRLFSARTIHYVHTVGFETIAQRGRLFRALTVGLFRHAHTVVCLGPTLTEDVVNFAPGARILTIPNAIEPPPKSDNAAPRDSLLYFSNLIPEKGADVFISCAIELAREAPDVDFVVAGASVDETYTEGLSTVVAAAGLGSRVSFVGAITDQHEKWRVMESAVALAFPSSYPFEAQPLSIIEAMAAGTPVVAFNVGGIRDIITDGEDGFLVPERDKGAMSARLGELATDPALRARMSKQAMDTYEERFSPTIYRRAWADVLNIDADRAPC